jgi:hypothetical protein
MNWEAIGAVGEIVGAIAVVVTVGYLAVQIRQNTRSVRDSAFQEVIHSIAEITTLLGTNPQSASLLRRATRSPDDLSEDEWLQFANLAYSMMNTYQIHHWLHERGLLDDSVWTPTVNNLRTHMSLPGFQAWWKRNPIALRTSFAEYVEREILSDCSGSSEATQQQPEVDRA